MRRRNAMIVLVATLFILHASVATAALVDLAAGAYGGVNMPLETGASAGTVIGAKVRVLPPIPLVGFEVWYSHFGYEDPSDVADSGKLSLALDGEGFDLYGVDVLIGSVRGNPGFSWYGSVGISAPEFDKIVKEVGDSTKKTRESERKVGGQVGFGIEIVPPKIADLGVEARATLMLLDLSGEVDDKMAIVTVGLNYYF
ncbi:MAG: hypothetical protein JXB46_10990 [Candidatus Eisenbacteria bacterium]|nr:hypothetical protein [Candidatus Eisenbacteria bacterium]